MKKLICLIITACLVLCLVSCRDIEGPNESSGLLNTVPSQNSAQKTINLLYSYSDSFNPYTATTAANRELSGLLYDCLVKTDNNFKPQLVLAKAVKLEGVNCTVELRDAKFTDGTAVTSDDVIYSYNLAKESVRFSFNFYEVKSVSAQGQKIVVFTLSQQDPYFANLLDFPIVKSNTSGKTDADGRDVAPVGCGRYYLSKDGQSLEQNSGYYGKNGEIKTINLINSPDSTSTSHYVEIGATDIYYTDSGDIVRMSGKKTEVNLNRLIFIGVNDSYGALQSKEMRYAISAALDRTAICRMAYYNNATAAKGFFNPCFEPTKAVQTIEVAANPKITVENLSKIGYNNMNADGFYSNSAGNNPIYTLLVNSENASRVAAAKLISEQCKTAGIQIDVIECTYEQYVARLETGAFQLYLGEVQQLDNMDMTPLAVSGGSAAYGVSEVENKPSVADGDQNEELNDTVIKKSNCKAVLSNYYNGECGISDVAITLLTEMPQIPICFLNGSLFYSSEIKGGIESSSSDIYLTIQNYQF